MPSERFIIFEYRSNSLRSLVTRYPLVCLHLMAGAAFAIAQRLYDLLAHNPTFFVAHRNGAGSIIGLVLTLSAGVPMLLAGIVLVSRPLSRSVAGGLLLDDVVRVAGTACRLPGTTTLRLLSLGIDPQIVLPTLDSALGGFFVTCEIRTNCAQTEFGVALQEHLAMTDHP